MSRRAKGTRERLKHAIYKPTALVWEYIASREYNFRLLWAKRAKRRFTKDQVECLMVLMEDFKGKADNDQPSGTDSTTIERGQSDPGRSDTEV